MKKADVVALLKEQLLPEFEREKRTVDRVDKWLRWDPDRPETGRRKSREHKGLMDMSRTPWLGHVVTVVAQQLHLERIYSATRTPDEMAAMWLPYQRNDMDSRQIPLHRAALAYGLAYSMTIPGDSGAVISNYSPRESFAFYGDPVEDEYPMYFLRVISQRNGKRHYRVVDEESVHFLSDEGYIESRPHRMGVCPVVRFANQLDLEGRAPGEVEPLIPIAARINKTDYDRLLAQHHNSWKVRTATKLDSSTSESDAADFKLKLAQDDILVGSGDTEFGALPETNLKHFIEAHDSDIETLAGVSQTPATVYGKLVNVSADGLIEAKASLRDKVRERQTSFGGAHLRNLRLAAHAEGRSADASDFTMKGYWADMEGAALAQAVDALGKAATMLGVPAELLWDRIPGVDLVTAESWRKYADEHPTAQERLADAYERQVRTEE